MHYEFPLYSVRHHIIFYFYLVAWSLIFSLSLRYFSPAFVKFFLVGANVICVHGFVDGSTCRCEEQWTGADCNTRMLKKRRRNEADNKGANLNILFYKSARFDVSCGNGFCAHIGWDHNECATSTSTLAAAPTMQQM